MGANSKIEWTDHTWNPWRGCEHATDDQGVVHPACENCYAETMSRQNPIVLGKWGSPAEGGTRVMGAPAYWKGPKKWRDDAKARGERRERVFCLSLGDFFEDWKGRILSHRAVIDDPCPENGFKGRKWNPVLWYRDDIGICEAGQTSVTGRCGERLATMDDLRRKVWPIIDETGDWLDWLLLTKRPQNIHRMWDRSLPFDGFWRKHVWLGATASDQRTLELVWPHLAGCYMYSPVLWLSIEPLLGPLDLENIRGEDGYVYNAITGEKRGTITRDVIQTGQLAWAVVGGESGAGARITHPDWIRPIRDLCDKHGRAFFYKQHGEFRQATNQDVEGPNSQAKSLLFIDREGADIGGRRKFDPTIGDVLMARLGAKHSGRMLDGREWSQHPHVYHSS